MYKIPEELRDLPEADRLRRAQAAFTAAAKEGRNLTFENEKRVRLVGERLRNAQNELGKAQKAFDFGDRRTQAGWIDACGRRGDRQTFSRRSA